MSADRVSPGLVACLELIYPPAARCDPQTLLKAAWAYRRSDLPVPVDYLARMDELGIESCEFQ